ncbi:glycine betaine ABC transporter substrate-binding protein [Williamsia sp.]|uniref:glycine betaine ABC transporter substrate-binding protein n=1 Tax=Williamsia sp. TaxID=1872085 RepID=UPI002F93581E
MPALVLAGSLVLAGCSEPGPAAQPLVTASTADTPSRVVTAIYAGALRDAGADVSDDHPVGDYGQLLAGMDDRSVDLMPAWSGELLGQLNPDASGRSSDEVYGELNQALPQGVSVGDATSVQNRQLVYVSAGVATAADADELADCARLPAGLPLVTVAEPDPVTVSELSGAGCAFAPPVVLSADEAIAEVAAGRAAGLFSALGVVGDDSGLQALTDSDDALRAQDLVPVYRTAALDRNLFRAMNKVAGDLTTADLTTMAAEVDGGAEVSAVAGRWLAEHSG